MEMVRQGSVALLFVEASHFVMGCDFLGYLWSRVRWWVKTFSGRKRYNVLATLDFITKKVLTVANDEYITATQVCELLRLVAKTYRGRVVHLVLDNARYQKCKVVTELAAELGITLNYLPAYSPNLNLIERLWKFVKAKICNVHFDDFDKFKSTIDSIIDGTNGLYKKEIDSLINQPHLLPEMTEISADVLQEVAA